MRVGILTFHFALNYGAVIQAWALQSYLKSLGHDVWIINYDPRVRRYPWWVHAWRKGWVNLLMEWRFRKFRQRHLKETHPVKSPSGISDLVLDAYVVGSDQVWNLDFFKDDTGHFNRTYFLPNVRIGAKRIAYACSIGEGGWDDRKGELSRLLENFDEISVREDFAKAVVETCVNRSVSVVPDPTLLITGHEFVQAFAKSTCVTRRTRIFVYGLNAADRCIKILREVLRRHPDAEVRMVKLGEPLLFAEAMSIRIVHPNPKEWVSEIANADIVITDSFHGVAVSINLGRNFFTLLKSEEPNCGDRIRTLLRALSLEDRIVDMTLDYIRLPSEKIDHEALAVKLVAYRERGLRFWKDALGGVR